MLSPSNAPSDPLARFARASLPRALWQLANTLPPFLALWGAMAWLHQSRSYAWMLVLALPAAALYLRLFIIQHDCGHGSFFRNARANRWLGASLGIITLFPFAYWKKTHAVHHATSGNLDKRMLGDIRTFTVTARVPNADHLLKDGMTADVTILVDPALQKLAGVRP